MCDKLAEEFVKLQLIDTEKNIIKNYDIYQIEHSYPGRRYSKWKQTNNTTFYINHEEQTIKVFDPRCTADKEFWEKV